MNKQIILGKRVITSNTKAYIIADIGVNHEGSMDLAKRLIDQAKEGGADAAKFQCYKAATLASKTAASYWDTAREPEHSQYDLFKKYDCFGPDEYAALSEHCQQIGIDFIATPFDDAAVDFLDPLVSFFKVSSADLTNVPFLRKIGAKGKPVILSTGASTLDEIDTALAVLGQSGCHDIALLHCILNYPTDRSNAHLLMIRGLQRTYPEKIIGYSDHTLPDDAMTSLVTAYVLGAVILEKHFTHNRKLPGNDHYHAMDQVDLARFVALMEEIQKLLGPTEHKGPIEAEEISRKNARRSIVLARDVASGKLLCAEDLTCKRPATGVSPLHWDEVLGRYSAGKLEADHILQWEDLVPIKQ